MILLIKPLNHWFYYLSTTGSSTGSAGMLDILKLIVVCSYSAYKNQSIDADLAEMDVIADYLFFMHVLHEIELIYLPDIIYSLYSKVKNGGKIFILDQKELVEEERSFVLWDDE